MFITHYDLQPFVEIELVKATAMIDDAEALAIASAPCLATTVLDDQQKALVRAVLRTAIIRWAEAGSGALVQETTGPFGVTYDNRSAQQGRGMLWPSEVDKLRDVCRSGDTSGAYSIDTLTGMTGTVHADICTLNFGGLYCSCGAVLTQNLPLYERYGW